MLATVIVLLGAVYGPPTGHFPQPRMRPVAIVVPDDRVARELGSIDRAIDRGRRAGDLSRRDGRRARAGRDQIEALADRYGTDGALSSSEQAELITRTELLRAEIGRERLIGGPR